MPPRGVPVRTQAPGHPCKSKGGEVRKTARLAENEEARIVGNQMQACKLNTPLPSNPPVAGAALEGTGLPASETKPVAVPLENIPKTTTGKTLEAEIVPLIHDCIPASTFVWSRKSDGHVGDPKAGRRFLELMHFRCHDLCITRHKPKSQQKIQPTMQTRKMPLVI